MTFLLIFQTLKIIFLLVALKNLIFFVKIMILTVVLIMLLSVFCVCISFFFNARVSLNYYFDSPNWLITTFFFFHFSLYHVWCMLYMSVLKTFYYVHVWNKICSVLYRPGRGKHTLQASFIFPVLFTFLPLTSWSRA